MNESEKKWGKIEGKKHDTPHGGGKLNGPLGEEKALGLRTQQKAQINSKRNQQSRGGGTKGGTGPEGKRERRWGSGKLAAPTARSFRGTCVG